MIIVISKDNGPATYIPESLALSFFRAFRGELWASGTMRDPQPGDEVLGVKIVSLTMGGRKMTLEKIFDQYTIGSDGFVSAIQTYCGFNISNDEVRRIAETAKTAAEFQHIWENENYWVQP